MLSRKPIPWFLAVLLFLAAGLAALAFRGAGADMTQAAAAFLEGLPEDKRQQASMEFDDPARLDWHFIPKAHRKGLQIKDMDPDQRKRAHALLAAGLSHVGYDKAVAVMSLEAILHELEKSRQGGAIRDPERYYFTVFGSPQADSQWGWSVEGHHLSLNFVVDSGKVVSVTPAFYGANPAEVKTDLDVGPKKGTRTLVKEEDLAFKLFNSLSDEQRGQALIAEKAPADLRGAGEPQPPDSSPEGLPAGQMNDDQRAVLMALLAAYTENMPLEVGHSRMAEVKQAGIEKVYFAWAGADKPGIGHYYRLQGPTFLVEFVNTQPDSLGNPANHIHSVWRQVGGDFGLQP
ncbi:MAG: DUF3500 domain-containing protein [Pirellulales bacterium]